MSEVQRPTVRAFPNGEDEDHWRYDIFLHDEDRWTGMVIASEARLLLRSKGLNKKQVIQRLQGARRRYAGKVNGTWKGDRR